MFTANHIFWVALNNGQSKNDGCLFYFSKQETATKLFPSIYLFHLQILDFQVAHFPFDDHNCPPIHLTRSFCQSAYAWLKEDIENVVVVHCKAGMARTGLMICSLLLFLKVRSYNLFLIRLIGLFSILPHLWACLLLSFFSLWMQFFQTSAEAIDYYNQKRCVDGKALVLPSQIVSHSTPFSLLLLHFYFFSLIYSDAY